MILIQTVLWDASCVPNLVYCRENEKLATTCLDVDKDGATIGQILKSITSTGGDASGFNITSHTFEDSFARPRSIVLQLKP